MPFSAFPSRLHHRCAQMPICSCKAQEWGGDGICKIFCTLRIREDQEQTNAWQKTNTNWKTDTQNISLEASKHNVHTPKGFPQWPIKGTSGNGELELPFPLCFTGSSYKSSPAWQVCLRHKGGGKGANFNPLRVFRLPDSIFVSLWGWNRRKVPKSTWEKLKASTSTSLIQRNPAAGT